jgi:protein O-mannosyl-transferase
MQVFSTHKTKFLFLVLILVIFSTLLYKNSLNNGFALDDTIIVEQNPIITNLEYTRYMFINKYWPHKDNANYRPLMVLSLALNYDIHELDPYGYHLVNMVLNALNAVLVFLLIYYLFGHLTLAFLAGLIFAGHPIHTEAVANVVGRAELLVTFFMLLSLIMHFKKKYGYAFVFLMIGALCKEFAVVTPFLAMVISLKDKRSLKEEIKPYLSYFFGIFTIIGMRYLICGRLSSLPIWYYNPLRQATDWERIMTAFVVFKDALWQMILPLQFSPDYSFNHIPVVRQLNAATLSGMTLMLALCLTGLWSLKKKRLYFVAIFFFLIPYMLTSNIIIPIETIRAERWMYFPSIGFALFFALLINNVLQSKKTLAAILAILLLTVMIGFYSIQTISRNPAWKDTNTLNLSSLEAAPNNYIVMGGAGTALVAMDNCALAAPLLEESWKHINTNKATLASLATCYEKAGNPQKSIALYKDYLTREPLDGEMHNNLAVMLSSVGKHEQALKHIRLAIMYFPNHIKYYKYNAASFYYDYFEQLKEKEKTIEEK